MKYRKGFMSTSVIYSFFLVFILLLIATMMSYTNKRYLRKKIENKIILDTDISYDCVNNEKLADCLLRAEFKEAKTSSIYGEVFKEVSYYSNNNLNIDGIKSAISLRQRPDFSKASTTEEGMYMLKDDKGNSYYYRGAEDDNYIKFNNELWRIVRINGNGTTRIIRNENIDGKTIYTSSWTNEETDAVKEKRQGYMFAADKDGALGTDSDSRVFLEKYYNNTSSNVKEIIDNYWENLLDDKYKNTTTLSYGAMFVGDKNVMNDKDFSIWENESIFPEGVSNFADYIRQQYLAATFTWDQLYYKSMERLFVGSNKIAPSLKCESSADAFGTKFVYKKGKKDLIYNLSCYSSKYRETDETKYITSEDDFLNKDKGNFSLKYPIATISADEIVLAGGYLGKENNKFYLYNGDDFWTMTLGVTDRNGWNDNTFDKVFSKITLRDKGKKGGYYFGLTNDGKLMLINGGKKIGIRPVVNLQNDVRYCSGDGSKDNPYIFGRLTYVPVEGTKLVCYDK